MWNCASPGGLLPEQVWDAAPIPALGLAPGRPSGSAMPLLWAHAEFLKLLIAREQRAAGRDCCRRWSSAIGGPGGRATAPAWHWRDEVPICAARGRARCASRTASPSLCTSASTAGSRFRIATPRSQPVRAVVGGDNGPGAGPPCRAQFHALLWIAVGGRGSSRAAGPYRGRARVAAHGLMSSAQVAAHDTADFHQIAFALRHGTALRAQMLAQVLFEYIRHQPVGRAAHRSNLLQHRGAFLVGPSARSSASVWPRMRRTRANSRSLFRRM